MNMIMLAILVAAKIRLKKSPAIFVEYGSDIVTFGFMSVFFFVYHYLMRKDGHLITTLILLPRTILFSVFVIVPVSLFFSLIFISADAHRLSYTGMWKWFGTDFRGAVLIDADFSSAHLRGADFRCSVLMHTCFYDAIDIELATFGYVSKKFIKNSIAIKTGHKFFIYSMRKVRKIATQANSQHANYSGESLEFLYMRKMDLSGANLDKSKLSRALFDGANLSDSSLRNADCHQASFENANFCNADLYEAVLVNADLRGADLRGTSLKLANLEGTRLLEARIDASTYSKSDWTPERLAELLARGITVSPEDVVNFPAEALERMRSEGGLLLSFSTFLSDVDRGLISNVIFDTLGPETDCRISDYSEHGRMALVLIKGAPRQDLERVAEAFYKHVWRNADEWCGKSKSSDPAGYQELVNKLDSLDARLKKIELQGWHGPSATHVSVAIAELRGLTQGGILPEAAGVNPVRLAIISAPEDQTYAAALINILATLTRKGIIHVWHQSQLLPGSNLMGECENAMDRANIVVFLVSPDLIASPLFNRMEFKLAAMFDRKFDFHVIPVLIRSTYLENTFFSLHHVKPLPSNSIPVAKWVDADEAWVDVMTGIHQVVDDCSHRGIISASSNQKPCQPSAE